MNQEKFLEAVEILKSEYLSHDWTYHDVLLNGKQERMFKWPGSADEDIIVVVHQSAGIQEKFHYHDYFYFNYTYSGSYESLSYKYDNKIKINEGELYAGQPFAGHALFAHDDQETTVIGLLIKRNVFFSNFLTTFTPDSKLFKFLVDPVTDCFADEFIRLKVSDSTLVDIIRLMVVEYAHKREDTQQIMRSLAVTYLITMARLCCDRPKSDDTAGRITAMLQYISDNSDTVTLKKLSDVFSYHPNYISAILTKETGKSFSQILLEERMARAVMLMKGTELPITEISLLLGYSNSSNFYKAFRKHYGMSPRDYIINNK